MIFFNQAIETIDNINENIKGQQMRGLMIAFNLIPESLSFFQLNILSDQGLVFLELPKLDSFIT